MRKVTIQDVAERAGVSKSTVSQYINKRYEYMSEETKKRIEEAINDLGYIPNYVAKSLKQKRTSALGVIVANILHTFSTEIIRAIEDVCVENGVHLFVCNADDDPDKERSYIEKLMAKQVDGLIIFPNRENHDLYLELKKMNFPIVFVDRMVKKPIYPILLLDNEKAAEMAVEELIQKGKTKIAVVSTSIARKITPRVERLAGYRKTLIKHGLETKEEWIIAVERELIVQRLDQLWQQPDRPEGFFAVNDLSLIELMRFLRKKNIRIPDDVGVTAIDDSPFLEIFTPPITVVKQPTFDIGTEAATIILSMISNSTLLDQYGIKRFQPTLIRRDSV